jgi:carboxyl-terminal processing protease
MDLGDGSAVRLTIGRYYTPTGRSIQKPYDKNGNSDYFKDYQKRITSGELLNKDSIKVVDSLKFTTPKGKIVYGGGGIIPDVFVAVDTTSYMSNFYFNSINRFAFEYVDKNRKELEKWTIDTFIENFNEEETVLNNYLASLKKDNIIPQKEVESSIKKYLTASLANTLFGDEGFYRIIHQEDKMILKVLELEAKKE